MGEGGVTDKSQLPEAPRFSLHVLELWKNLQQKLIAGENVSIDRAAIDYEVSRFSESVKRDGEAYDKAIWFDLEIAKGIHARLSANADHSIAELNRLRDFWKSREEAVERLATQIMLEVCKYVLALHGAVVVACATSLVSDKVTSFRSIVVFMMACGLVGLLLLAASYGLLLKHFSDTVGKIRNQLFKGGGWRSLIAIHRWQNLSAVDRRMKAAEALFLASLVWLAIYMMISLLILASF